MEEDNLYINLLSMNLEFNDFLGGDFKMNHTFDLC